MRAPELLRRNLQSLLDARRESQASLAQYLGKDKSWINKFLTGTRDELQLQDLDRIADFFGLATYQLFTPGISALTERRIGGERRSGRERRVGHQIRLMRELGSALGSIRSGGGANVARSVDDGGDRSVPTRPAPDNLRAFLRDTEARLTALLTQTDAGGQTPAPGAAKPAARPHPRRARGRDSQKTG